MCNLLAFLLSFPSSALPPLFLFFFISKIQFSLPLTSSRNSLHLPRYLLHSDLFLPLSPSFSFFLSLDLSFANSFFPTLQIFRTIASSNFSLYFRSPPALSDFLPRFSYFVTLPSPSSRSSSHFHPFLPSKFHSQHHLPSSLSSRPLILTSSVLLSPVRIFPYVSHDLPLPHVVPPFRTFPNPVIFHSAFLLLSLHLSIFLPF